MTAKADGAELSQRLSKIETAISRRKTIEFSYYTIERDSKEKRKVDPYHLVYRGGQFYLIGHSHERDAIRVFRLSRIKGKVSYASKAEHDFSPPERLRAPRLRAPGRVAARRDRGHREDLPARADRLAGRARLRLLRRDPQPAKGSDGAPGKGQIFETEYASSRQMVAWVLHWRQNATVLEPPELARRGRRAPGAADRAATPASSSSRTRPGRSPHRRRGRARTAAPSRRSGPSASPAW